MTSCSSLYWVFLILATSKTILLVHFLCCKLEDQNNKLLTLVILVFFLCYMI
jgi:hypothetical protein